MGLPKQIHAEVNVGTHEIGWKVPKFRNLKLRQQTGFSRLDGGFRRARRMCAVMRVCLCRAASSHPLTAASVQRLRQENLLKLQPCHTEKKSFNMPILIPNLDNLNTRLLEAAGPARSPSGRSIFNHHLSADMLYIDNGASISAKLLCGSISQTDKVWNKRKK